MNKLIIVEGPQGAGKSTLTNLLRESMTSTNLIRMSGVADKTVTGKTKSRMVHLAQLNAIMGTYGCDMNYILDRSFLSELVYAEMGLKPYNTDDTIDEYRKTMEVLKDFYEVILVKLIPEKEVLEQRLKRTKAAYEPFNVESSLKQIEALEKVLNKTSRIWKNITVLENRGNIEAEDMVKLIIGSFKQQ